MPDETPASPAAPTSRRRRLAIRLGIGFAAALTLFVLVVFVLPSPLARYVIDGQLENLGIEHDGIDTVDIDLWNSHVRAGPVTFHSGQAQRGQIGETGFDYSFGAFFEGRAFVQTFYLHGVDLHIARLEDGAIEINGINLQEIGAPEEETAEAEQAAEETEEGSGFEVGVERFEFADSQLVFEDVTGGTLTIEVDRLTLDRLLTWTPEEPTSFALEGRLNEMDLTFDGTIVPLGDPLRFTFNSRVTGITLDRVARFIGPTGLARQDGNLNTEVHYAYAIHSDGRVEGTVDGTYNFSDFEIATPEGETASLGQALLKVDLEQKLQPDGSASASGQLRLEASPLAIASAEGDALEFGGVELAFSDLHFIKGVERRRRLLEDGTAENAAPSPAPRAASIVELMIGWARELGQEALTHELEINGKPTLALKDGLIRLAARGDDPAHEIRFQDMTVDLGEVVTEAFDRGVSTTGSLEALVSALRYAAADGSARAEVSSLDLNSGSVELQATTEETVLAFDLRVLLEQLTSGLGQGQALDLSSVSLATGGFTIRQSAESEEASGPVSVSLQQLVANLPGVEGNMTLQSEALDLNLKTLSLTGKESQAGSFAGSLEARDITLQRDSEAPLSVALESSRSELKDIRVAPLGPQAEITGGLSTSLSGLELQSGQDSESFSLALDNLENHIEGLRASGFDSGEMTVALANRTSLNGLTASVPLGADGAAEAKSLSLTLNSLENQAEGLQASSSASGETSVTLANRTSLNGLTASVPLGADGAAEAKSLSLTLDSLENQAEGLQASSSASGETSVTLANRIRLSGLKASLPLGEGETAEAGISTLEAPLSELAYAGAALRARGGLEVTGIVASSGGDSPQSLDLASLSISGLNGGSETGIEAESISLGELIATLTLPLPGTPAESTRGGDAEGAAEAVPVTTAEDESGSADPATSPDLGDQPIKVGSFTLAPGSRIEITDGSVAPPLQASVVIDELNFGPLDTGAPDTRTDLALALTANETSRLTLQGWASPFKPKPDFELASRVEAFSLPQISPYAAQAVGVNIESGALTADVAANASNADLLGNIDLKIDDLFVTPLSEEEAEKIKADIGLPVGFAVSILKDSEGVIAFGLPLSGTVQSPQVDYSEAIDKAISGAMASVFPTNWFGPDGNTFEMQPAPFEPGTTKLTADGQAVADQMGELFADKPGISIRACGRAGRDDLMALRGNFPEPPNKLAATDPPAPDADATPSDEVTPASAPADAAATPAGSDAEALQEIAEPSKQEIEKLLALASDRGVAIRQYLETTYGIDPEQVPKCRTAYSIKDGKSPRAEFQF